MKKKTIEFTLNPKQFPFNVVTRQLSATQKRQLQKVVKRELNVVRDHFERKGHGWALDWRILRDGIFYEVFGSLLETYLMAQFVGVDKKLVLEGAPRGLYLKKRSRDPLKRSKRVRK